jgi:Myb/SANT-like DNA-binding domain
VLSLSLSQRKEERGAPESEETDDSPPDSSDWSEEWATKFLKLVLEHCRSGEMTGPDLTTEAWHSVLHRFEESVQSQFQIEHLKEKLRYYEHRYRVITEMIKKSSFEWDPNRRFLVQGGHHFKV